MNNCEVYNTNFIMILVVKFNDIRVTLLYNWNINITI